MSTESLITGSLDVNSTLGALLIGFAASCVVFGVLSLQCFSYFMRYPLDRPLYKLLVAFLWTIETADQAIIGHVTYHYTVSNYLSPLAIFTENVVWSLIVQIILGVIVGTVVKLCFAVRVWRFSNHNIFVTGIIFLLTLGQFGLAIAYSVRAFQVGKFDEASQLKMIASLSLGAGAVTDIVIALSLSYFLRRMRTGFQRSDTLINMLTRYAINTGALTSAISIATLIAYDTSPTTFIFVALYFILSKLYAISFLCTLNTRRIVRGKGTDREAVTSTTAANMYGSNMFFMVNHPSRVIRKQSQTASQLEIGVHHEVSVVSDVVEDQTIIKSNLQENRIEQTQSWR